MDEPQSERRKPPKRPAKKRKFCGNMYTGSIKTDADKLDKPNQKCKMNASFSKLNEPLKKKLKITKDKDLQGNRVIDIRLLVEFIQKLVCPDC